MSLCTQCLTKICSKLYYSYLGRRLLIPSRQIKYVGQTASFECITLQDTKWLFQGGTLPNNVVLTNHYNWKFKTSADRLTITKVNLNNAGKYTCIMGDFLEAEGVLVVMGK